MGTTLVTADIVIIGGGVGGCAAAISALESGATVVLTEEYPWIGGQFTSQCVPPDENPMIDTIGSTRRYRTFRRRIQRYYRDHFPVKPQVYQQESFNPGNGNVSALCANPDVPLRVLDDWLAPFRFSGKLRLLEGFKLRDVVVENDSIHEVTVASIDGSRSFVLRGSYFLDGSETGDLIAQSGTEYRTGSEARHETNEPSAGEHANPLNHQAASVCFAMDWSPETDNVGPTPDNYNQWRKFVPELSPPWPGPQFSWTASHPHQNNGAVRRYLFNHPDSTGHDTSLWYFRRILDKENFDPGFFPSDITSANWPQIDFLGGPLFEIPEDEAAANLAAARNYSRCFFHWMQTEAPRDDESGTGYPELRLRGDLTGETEDGLAMAPYIREGRRIHAEFTILEQHVATRYRDKYGAEKFNDSVGIGWYPIDLHPTTGGHNYRDWDTDPFQIPMGALIPIRMRNLLPAGKNIGTTHITNGCYRLHPIEWNIGEVAGLLAVASIEHFCTPREIYLSKEKQKDFRSDLFFKQHIPLEWPRIFKRSDFHPQFEEDAMGSNQDTAPLKDKNESIAKSTELCQPPIR